MTTLSNFNESATDLSAPVGVLAVMDGAFRVLNADVHDSHGAMLLREARAAVAELIAAAKRANGDHTAPHDCYATGPSTGDDYLDLVSCPGCELAAALLPFTGDKT